MQQMRAPAALVERTTVLSESSGEFFKVRGDAAGRVFFGCPMGGTIYPHVVFEDGAVSRNPATEKIVPDQSIEVIDQSKLGTRRYWA